MIRKLNDVFLVAICMIATIQTSAQLGGRYVYDFLEQSPSARIQGLGGKALTAFGWDGGPALYTPSLLHNGIQTNLSISTGFYPAGISQGNAHYIHQLPKYGLSLQGAIQYMNYGSFDAADVAGNITGSFRASEYALILGGSKAYSDKLRFGANMKLIASYLEGYDSYGGALDLSGSYIDTSSRVVISAVFRNIGTQFSTYAGEQEPLPFEILVGFSKRLAHLPFRFHITMQHLERWNIRYDNPDSEDAGGLFPGTDQGPTDGQIAIDNFFRHFVFGGEFLLGKYDQVQLRFGYDHFRRGELLIENTRGLAGFNFGFGLKVKTFRIDYGRSIYHQGGGLHHFSLSTRLGRI